MLVGRDRDGVDVVEVQLDISNPKSIVDGIDVYAEGTESVK